MDFIWIRNFEQVVYCLGAGNLNFLLRLVIWNIFSSCINLSDKNLYNNDMYILKIIQRLPDNFCPQLGKQSKKMQTNSIQTIHFITVLFINRCLCSHFHIFKKWKFTFTTMICISWKLFNDCQTISARSLVSSLKRGRPIRYRRSILLPFYLLIKSLPNY